MISFIFAKSSFLAVGLFFAISLMAKAALHRTTVPLSVVFWSNWGMARVVSFGYSFERFPMVSDISHLTRGALWVKH
jgi:hypothetical protein